MKKKEETPIVNHASIIQTPLEEIMGTRFGSYSKYIIQDRALPDARDGLKPVQRRILYAMYRDGNTWDKAYRKSAKTVGLVIGNYHPHGDSSVYDAMVRMSQDWKIRHPQIDMQGNNGSIDDDPAAAMRYTEARLGKISEYLLRDIDADTVTWSLNFDDTELEPTVLPTSYPNLLVNGITGIAAGYATNIPPHNLSESIDAAIYRIQYPNSTLEELMEYIQGPDFPTGGIVQGIDGIKEAFQSGKGRIMVRSKVTIEQTKTIQQIVVHEIPYEVVKSNMVKKIDDVRLNKKIDGILDVRDESDRNGLRVVVDIKKDADAQLILNFLYKNTDLQVSYNYNVVAIVNKRPIQMGLIPMLDAFIAHRHEVIEKRSRFELHKKEKRCHILDGLIKAVSVLDEIIRLIRASKDKADSKSKIMEAFGFSDEQAEAIVTMRLYRLSSTDITQLREEDETLKKEIAQLKNILEDPKTLRKVIVSELKNVQKLFPTPRLTSIEHEIEEIVIDKVAMINNEQVMFTISRDGYVKRVSMRSYNAGSDTMTGIKEGDHLIGYGEVNTLDNIMFFTNQGTYGYTPVYEVEEQKWKDIGSHINSNIKITGDEKITDAFVVNSFKTNAYIISTTRLGLVKKTFVSDYEVSRNNKTMSNMKLLDGDEVVSTFVGYDGDEILIATKNGYVSRYPISLIPLTSPRSKGVKAIKLVSDTVASACVYRGDAKQLVVFSDNCALKRLKMSDIEITGRPTKGNMICKKVKSKPYMIEKIEMYDLNDEIIVANGDVHKIVSKDIALMSKDATFSTPIPAIQDFYTLEKLSYIEQIEKTQDEVAVEEKEVEEEFEEFTLFE
ncbi:MAG: DNA topoisomerase IV subunit A [Longicatena sp.]